jgi:hypothetical protein
VIGPQLRVAKAEQAKGRAMEAQGRAEEMRAQPLNALLSAIGAGIASGDSDLDLTKLPALIRSALNLLPGQPAGDSAMPAGGPDLLSGVSATADADTQMGYDAITLSDGDRNKADQLLRTQGKTPEESKKILDVVMPPPPERTPWLGEGMSPEQRFGETYEGALPRATGYAGELLGEIGRKIDSESGPEGDLLGEISRVLRAPGSPLALLGLAPDPYESVSTIPSPEEMGRMVLTEKALDRLVEKAKTDPEAWDLLDRIARGVGVPFPDIRTEGNARAQEALITRVGARPK